MTERQIALSLAYAVLALWAVFVFAFLLAHPRRSAEEEVKRAPRWWIGFVLQALGYAMVWILRREFGTPISHMPLPLQIALTISAMGIGVASAWLALEGMRELGRQWAVAARIVAGHELVTSGPFQVVRHPIYSGMLGLLIATAVAFTTWLGLIVAVALYVAGTSMRIRTEERLLRETFGDSYDAYAREVPALVPGLF